MTTSSASPRKLLKILCLHGYQQNESIFRQKTGGLRRILKNYVQFEFINAPHVVHQDDEVTANEEKDKQQSNTTDGNFGWWLFVKDEANDSTTCKGLEKSIDLIEKTFQEKGPFDGLLAFSQGATLAAILSIYLQEKKLNADFKFVIIIAGAHSRWEPLSKFSEKKIDLPSLHIIGENDQIIPQARSEAFRECFVNSQCGNHPGGHYVPVNPSLKEVYCSFIKDQLEKIHAVS